MAGVMLAGRIARFLTTGILVSMDRLRHDREQQNCRQQPRNNPPVYFVPFHPCIPKDETKVSFFR